MIKSFASGKIVTGLAFIVGIAGCGRGDSREGIDSAAPAAAETSAESADAAESAGPITLTTADLDGFEKGIARETELVRVASDRASKATTPQERGEAIQAGFEENTMTAAAPATGLSVERYRLVRKTLSKLLTTLDFQGKIDGPQSLDTSRADAATKGRLASDPYLALDPASANELKARLSRIVPLWVEYVNLTVVAG